MIAYPARAAGMFLSVGVGDKLRNGGGRDRISSLWDATRASFGLPAGLAMLLGLALGLLVPGLDELLGVDLPVLSFESQSSARSLLETIGTTTVAVAGLSFSVTVVAFTLASSQLSPRVLRSFRSDRFSQLTLALLLGTFIYCLTLLVRLGVNGEGAEPPNLSVTLAVLLAFVSFAMFAGFIGHIVNMLQPSSVIEAIRREGIEAMPSRYPAGGDEPDDASSARARAERIMNGAEPRVIEAGDSGYLHLVDLEPLIAAAGSADALIRQCAPVGAYLLPRQPLAEVWLDADDGAEMIEDAVRAGFELGRQRTLVQDVAFPVRQLADIALKGLSPGINDPTTAENAMEAMDAVLVEFASSDRPSAIRVDADGEPRLLAMAPDLDELVRLGFDQVRVFAGSDPVVSLRLLELLDHLRRVAIKQGLGTAEIERQRDLIAAGIGREGPIEADQDRVRAAATAAGPPAR